MQINVTLNPKSFLLGAAASAVLFLATGATSVGGPPGRYQVSVGNDKAAIVDTMTGQCWTADITANGAVTTIGTNTFLTTKGN